MEFYKFNSFRTLNPFILKPIYHIEGRSLKSKVVYQTIQIYLNLNLSKCCMKILQMFPAYLMNFSFHLFYFLHYFDFNSDRVEESVFFSSIPLPYVSFHDQILS